MLSGWELKDGLLGVMAEIPANTTARVRLPQIRLDGVAESGQPMANAKGILRSSQEGQARMLEVGSGCSDGVGSKAIDGFLPKILRILRAFEVS